ncbi:MAG: NAD(P)/FAD-dependent oxidoreductase [Candidatus Woesearchaeota archaeon]
MRVVIIGGGSAGTSAAFELRKRSKDIEITILEKSPYPEYSPCALPYVLSGEIGSFDDIFIFSPEDYEREGITLVNKANVEGIDRAEKHVNAVVDAAAEDYPYDALIIATGSEPHIPFPIRGPYHTLRSLDDAKTLDRVLESGRRLAVVGAGLIGLEAAHAGIERGMDVSVYEAHERILAGLFDADMERRITSALGIDIATGVRVLEADGQLTLEDKNVPYDVLLIATGLTPDTRLARDAGLDVEHGIIVDLEHRTSDPSIYAVGDCCEIEHLFGARRTDMLGTLAFQAAPLIAGSILNEPADARPTLGAAISRIGPHTFASSGLTLEGARALGIEAVGALIRGTTRSEYYPGEYPMSVKLVARDDGVIIGGQILGREDVAGRINLISLAISHEHTAAELARLETVYNPASAPIHEPISIAAQMLTKKLKKP